MNARKLTDTQIALIQQSWDRVEPIRTQASALFYGRLFERDPALRAMFNADLVLQGERLMSMMRVAVRSLSSIDDLIPDVQDLGRRHAAYGVRDEHYDMVGETLIWTLEQGLGDSFTAATREAWIAVYRILADVMKSAANESSPSAHAA